MCLSTPDECHPKSVVGHIYRKTTKPLKLWRPYPPKSGRTQKELIMKLSSKSRKLNLTSSLFSYSFLFAHFQGKGLLTLTKRNDALVIICVICECRNFSCGESERQQVHNCLGSLLTCSRSSFHLSSSPLSFFLQSWCNRPRKLLRCI